MKFAELSVTSVFYSVDQFQVSTWSALKVYIESTQHNSKNILVTHMPAKTNQKSYES